MSVHLKHLGWIIETWGQAWKRLMSIFTWAAGSAPWWSGFPEREPDRLSVNLSSRLHRFQLVSICCCFHAFCCHRHTHRMTFHYSDVRVCLRETPAFSAKRVRVFPQLVFSLALSTPERETCAVTMVPRYEKKTQWQSLWNTHNLFITCRDTRRLRDLVNWLCRQHLQFPKIDTIMLPYKMPQFSPNRRRLSLLIPEFIATSSMGGKKNKLWPCMKSVLFFSQLNFPPHFFIEKW